MTTATKMKSADPERYERARKNVAIATANAAAQRVAYETKLTYEFAARIIDTGARMLEPSLRRRGDHATARHCLDEARKLLRAALEQRPDEPSACA